MLGLALDLRWLPAMGARPWATLLALERFVDKYKSMDDSPAHSLLLADSLN